MKIGLLLTGHAPDPLQPLRGDYDAMFTRLLAGQGLEFDSYDVENMVFPESIDAADGWLISGSRHGAYEDHPFIPPLERFIRQAYAARIPIVGICFGHQIVAQALGGKVVKHPEGWALGRQDYEMSDGRIIRLNAWHQDQVRDLPPDAKPIARSAFCEYAMLTYGDRAFTVQPHPEFDGNVIADFVALRKGTGTYPDDLMDRAAESAALPDDSAALARAIGDFFKTGVVDVPA
ncbi:GMP synthase [glutamine-hydrolyzing] [Jannaschia seosinensis]|uniref:GMP synthase [glutamine-hydrolyzing] n=1 Tax=Jannaschia seosinensis TaxID=313367 RepID=A0A0M7B6Y7_9RHOB|nr:type 1 glutamine amidotransferase [Jannaschia seosinensis]CUH18713.1 GMP synthase [glutamine-hydrolyzing] [Jannaschia seosinensis]